MDPSYGEVHLGTCWKPEFHEEGEGALQMSCGTLQCQEALDGGARIFPADSGVDSGSDSIKPDVTVNKFIL